MSLARGWHAHKKNKRNEKIKNTKFKLESPNVTLVETQQVSQSHSQKSPALKTKKCQPVAGDMPDLIQTEHVPSKGLARPYKKINKSEKYEEKKFKNEKT